MSQIIFINGLKIEDQPEHKFCLLTFESGNELIELVLPNVLADDLYLKLKDLYIDHNGLYTKKQIKEHLEKLASQLKEIVSDKEVDTSVILAVFREVNNELLQDEATL